MIIKSSTRNVFAIVQIAVTPTLIQIFQRYASYSIYGCQFPNVTCKQVFSHNPQIFVQKYKNNIDCATFLPFLCVSLQKKRSISNKFGEYMNYI